MTSPAGACTRFEALPPLWPGVASAGCCASVTIPVCNEEHTLAACLDALRGQVHADGTALPLDSFEVLLLLNNCTDNSRAVVARWHRRHPELRLLIAECHFEKDQAHAGTARRALMDTAWRRLGGEHAGGSALILSTDADSEVARDWIAQNFAACRAGAEAVGGSVQLHPEQMATLPPAVQECYRRDRAYAAAIARLEDLLDPQVGDQWPRHLDHFGSSLACTAEAYARAGGMPAVSRLEDEAFVDRLRRANITLRHEPTVLVYTSARLHGRAAVGMAGQLRCWEAIAHAEEHTVPSAAYLIHRFEVLRRLRQAFKTGDPRELAFMTEEWRNFAMGVLHEERSVPDFLLKINCDGLVWCTFAGIYMQPIEEALEALGTAISRHHASRPRLEQFS